jgi:hypothetical protein
MSNSLCTLSGLGPSLVPRGRQWRSYGRMPPKREDDNRLGRLDMERGTKAKAPDARDVEVGRRIRAQRLVRRLSQTELANKLTFQQLHKYEKGANRVGAGRLARIAEVLNVPVSFFFSGDHTPSESDERVNSGLRFPARTALGDAPTRCYDQP